MRQSSLNRGTKPLVRRTPLAKVGRRMKSKRARRAAIVKLVRERDRGCQFYLLSARVLPLCAGPLDVHEVIPRSAWPDGDLDELNCVLLCRRHHDWVGDNPNLAHDVGLHGFSWERPIWGAA